MSNREAPRLNSGRALELLTLLLNAGWYDREALASELVVTKKQIDDYVSQREKIPLDRQLCLALFVIEQAPKLSAMAVELHDEVRAEMALRDVSHLGSTAE